MDPWLAAMRRNLPVLVPITKVDLGLLGALQCFSMISSEDHWQLLSTHDENERAFWMYSIVIARGSFGTYNKLIMALKGSGQMQAAEFLEQNPF